MQNNDAAQPLPSLSFQQRRRQLLLLAGGLVFIGIAALGIYWWVSGRFYESTDDAYIGGNVAVISPASPAMLRIFWSPTMPLCTQGNP